MIAIKNIRNRWFGLPVALKLVAVNAAVFVVLRLVAIVIRFSVDADDADAAVDTVVGTLLLPRTFTDWLHAPWTAVTYMFVQYDPMHLMMNMIWLYLFGTVAVRILSGRNIYGLYFLGGISGAVFYIVANAMAGGVGTLGLTGASASILAIMGASMVLAPGMKLHLVIFGEATLRIVGLIAILLVVIATGEGNYGTHAAHAGGLLAGMGYAYVLRGKTERKRGAQAAPAHREMDTETATPCTDSLDQLLDKIRRSGFNSLTAVERARLIKISSNLQNRQS